MYQDILTDKENSQKIITKLSLHKENHNKVLIDNCSSIVLLTDSSNNLLASCHQRKHYEQFPIDLLQIMLLQLGTVWLASCVLSDHSYFQTPYSYYNRCTVSLACDFSRWLASYIYCQCLVLLYCAFLCLERGRGEER